MGQIARRSAAAVGVVDDEVEALQVRIEGWRKTRTKRTAMPEELWSAAIALTERRTVYSVAHALKLNYQTLRARVLEAKLSRRPAASEAATPTFVELTAAQVFSGVDACESEVELVRDSGERMTIRTSGRADITALSELFWSCGR